MSIKNFIKAGNFRTVLIPLVSEFGANSALLLSLIADLKEDDQGDIMLTAEFVTNSTGLTKKMQVGAIDNLANAGIISRCFVKNMPQRRFVSLYQNWEYVVCNIVNSQKLQKVTSENTEVTKGHFQKSPFVTSESDKRSLIEVTKGDDNMIKSNDKEVMIKSNDKDFLGEKTKKSSPKKEPKKIGSFWSETEFGCNSYEVNLANFSAAVKKIATQTGVAEIAKANCAYYLDKMTNWQKEGQKGFGRRHKDPYMFIYTWITGDAAKGQLVKMQLSSQMQQINQYDEADRLAAMRKNSPF